MWNRTNRNPGMGSQRPLYVPVSGVISRIQPFTGSSVYDPCTRMITVEDEEGRETNFFIHPDTFVVDYVTLYESMPVTVFYDGNAPVPLIYPPQFSALVAAKRVEGQMIKVDYFNQLLLASDQSLKLNLSPATEVVTTNNQPFAGTPANHTLAVLYSRTTRSLPPQTTPDKIIVLCGR